MIGCFFLKGIQEVFSQIVISLVKSHHYQTQLRAALFNRKSKRQAYRLPNMNVVFSIQLSMPLSMCCSKR